MDFISDLWEDSKTHFFTIFIPIVGVIAVVVLGVIAFVSHTNGIHEGTVVSKNYEAEYSILQCSSDGSGSCMTLVYPEEWKITISKGDEKNRFSISKAEFNRIHKGDYLTFDGENLKAIKKQ